MDKKNLIVMIARDNAGYGAWIENCPGVYGEGNTVQEVKKELLEGLDLFLEYNKKENLPEILRGEYGIKYCFDIPSFLEYYSGVFTKAALERITGINQKQIGHYMSGYRNPSKKTIARIDNALQQLAGELSQVRLAV